MIVEKANQDVRTLKQIQLLMLFLIKEDNPWISLSKLCLYIGQIELILCK